MIAGGRLSPNPALRHIRALDGLRGAAVVAVLLFHAGHLTGGYLGVDLFFVLSGFLITSLLLAEWRGTSKIRLGAFWARRARRLLPALCVVLLGVSAFAVFVAPPTALARIREDALATVGYVANWHSIGAGHSYWALFSAPSPLEHTWSLAIEEQFYLLWPLAVVGLGAATKRHRALAPRVFALALIGASALGALAIGLTLSDANDTRVYLGTDTRAPAILLGAALAAWTAWRGTARSRSARIATEVVGFLGVAWLVWAWTSLDGQDPDLLRGGLLLSGVAGVAILAAAAHPKKGPIAVVLGFAPLCWLGLVSYGLYLWHWPVYVWLDTARTGLDGWALTGVRIVVSVALAATSYFVVELPIRRGALHGRPIRVLAPLAAATTIALILITTIGAVSQPTTAQSIARGRHRLEKVSPPTPDVRRFLVVGDSVAWSIGKQIDGVKSLMGIESFNEGVVACQIWRADAHRDPLHTPDHPTEGMPIDPVCKDWPNRWRNQLALAQPSDVLLELGFPAVEDDEVGGIWHAACSPWWRRFTQSESVQAIDLLGSTGARVWVATVVPATNPETGNLVEADNVACLNRMLRRAVKASSVKASVVDLEGFLCNLKRDRCRLEIDGEPIRTDLVHYDGPGGRAVSMWLVRQMTQKDHR